jgi:DNA-binding transcriptional MocR family regulator
MPDSDHLLALMAPDWRSRRPLYRALAATLRGAISSGELAADERLPSERELAKILSVSRSTVVSCYDALRAGGWVSSRSGSGTFVTARTGMRPPLRMHEMVATESPRSAPLGSELVNFSISKPRTLSEMLSVAIAESAEQMPDLTASVEYAPQGLPALREAIAEQISRRGLPTSPGQVIVTSGAQQAISLVAHLFVDAGDFALVESPTYLGCLDVLRARRARLVALPASGAFDSEAAAALTRRARPSLAFFMPNCHTVTGAAIGAEDRARLARISLEMQLPLVEDDIFAGMVIAGEEAPPIAAFAEDAPVFTVGSLSKLIWNGMRIGWLRAPEAMVTRLVRMKSTTDMGTSLISQAVALNLMRRSETIVRLRRHETIAARSHASDLLHAALPEWSWEPPSGGRSLWLRLPAGSATAFAQVAGRHGVIVVPGPALSPDAANDDHLRMMFLQPKSILQAGIERLAIAWADYAPTVA